VIKAWRRQIAPVAGEVAHEVAFDSNRQAFLRGLPFRARGGLGNDRVRLVVIVQRVVDGDTLLLEEGTRVRLIGVDTPESVAPNRPVEPLGTEAAEFTRSQVEGRHVTLGFDRERRDRYRRILAYVYVDDRLLNEELIRAGFSRAETRFPYDPEMKRRFRTAEDEARGAHRGLWAAQQ